MAWCAFFALRGFMKFEKGKSGNPKGRPVGSVGAMRRAMDIILKVFSDNEDKFELKLRSEISKDPVGYYRYLITPLMPKEISLSGGIEVNNTTRSKSEVIGRIAELEKQIKSRTSKKVASGSKGS